MRSWQLLPNHFENVITIIAMIVIISIVMITPFCCDHNCHDYEDDDKDIAAAILALALSLAVVDDVAAVAVVVTVFHFDANVA